ncbi:MAG: hypothetical protein IKN62_00725 [Elusimicrobia bacterium]|nr:hypothetical protein [Elusimicrobiota bacterium]
MELLSTIRGSIKTLSTLATMYNGALAINNRFIVRKIVKFSEKELDEKVIQDYVNSIDIYHWEEIQDAIIHQLTQAESIVKAGYERNLVEALLTRKITDADFWRMNFVLQHLYTLDIKDLVRLYNGGSCSEEKKKMFLLYGLLDDKGITKFENESMIIGQQQSSTNDFGKKFVEAIKDS